MLAKTKLFALCCCALLFGAVLFFVANLHSASAAGGQCGTTRFSNEGAWVNSYKIDCGDEYFLDPRLSANHAGFWVFVGNSSTADVIVVSSSAGTNGGAVKVPRSSVEPGGNLSVDCNQQQCIDNIRDISKALSDNDPKNSAGQTICNIHKPMDCKPYDGPGSDGMSSKNFLAASDLGPNQKQNLNTMVSQTNANLNQAKSADDCENNVQLGWVFCPVLINVTQGITNIVQGPLIDLLKVQPLSFSSNPNNGTSGIDLQPSVQAIIYLADALYVLLFIILLFANAFALGIDNYTVKKTLPRLIAAVVLTQFAYIICAFAIDMGNLLGTMLPTLIQAGTNSIPYTQAVTSIVSGPNSNGLVSLGSFFIVIIAAVAILIVLLIAMIYMLFRNLGIYVLVIASPIAFAAMVLPGTQKYFKMWGTNFIKLILMFPMVTSILAIAAVVVGALSKIPNPSTSLQLLIVAVPVIALAMIPKCLKWTGELMEVTAGAVASYAGGKAGAARKSLPEHSDKLSEARKNKIAQSKFGDTRIGRLASGAGAGSLFNSKGSVKRQAQRVAAARSEADKYANIMYSRIKAKAGADDVKRDADLVNLYNKSDKATRASLLKIAGNSGDNNLVKTVQTGGSITDASGNVVARAKQDKSFVDEVMTDNWKDFDSMPQLRPGFDASKLNGEKFVSASGGSQKEILRDHGASLPAATYRELISSDAVRSKLDPEVLNTLKDIADNTRAGHAAAPATPPGAAAALHQELSARNML